MLFLTQSQRFLPLGDGSPAGSTLQGGFLLQLLVSDSLNGVMAGRLVATREPLGLASHCLEGQPAQGGPRPFPAAPVTVRDIPVTSLSPRDTIFSNPWCPVDCVCLRAFWFLKARGFWFQTRHPDIAIVGCLRLSPASSRETALLCVTACQQHGTFRASN